MNAFQARKHPAVLESVRPLSNDQLILIEQLYIDGIKKAFEDTFEAVPNAGTVSLKPGLNKGAAMVKYRNQNLDLLRFLRPIVIRDSTEMLSRVGAA